MGVKVVIVDRPGDSVAADTVLVDNRRGAHEAVRHLIDQGHQRIGYLGDRDDIWTIRERFAGYLGACAEAALLPDPALVIHGLRSRAAAADAAVAMMSHPDPPTAIFASNDLVTMGTIDGLRGPGSRHGSAALVGFDEFVLADKLNPSVTVVAQDPSAMGTIAAQMLFDRIAGDTSPPRQIVLPTRLIIRGSGEIAPADGPVISTARNGKGLTDA
jgi:LacI family transcriptional regulator